MKLIAIAALAGLLFSQGPIVPASKTVPPSTEQKPHEHVTTDPWNGLFRVEPVQSANPQLVALAHLKAEALHRSPKAQRGPCNMPIVPANPDVDPSMIVPIPRDRADAKIRIVEPAVCGHASPGDAQFVKAVPIGKQLPTRPVPIDRKR